MDKRNRLLNDRLIFLANQIKLREKLHSQELHAAKTRAEAAEKSLESLAKKYAHAVEKLQQYQLKTSSSDDMNCISNTNAQLLAKTKTIEQLVDENTRYILGGISIFFIRLFIKLSKEKEKYTNQLAIYISQKDNCDSSITEHVIAEQADMGEFLGEK